MKCLITVAGLLLCVSVAPAQLARVQTPAVSPDCAANPKAAPCQVGESNSKQAQTLKTGPRRLSRGLPARSQAAATGDRTAGPALSRIKRYAVPLQLPAGDARARFFHSRTAIAAGVNLKAWREGGLYAKIGEQLKTAGVPGGWEAFRPMIEELDEAWILLDATSRQGQPVVLLTGRFENPLWKLALSARTPLTGANAVLVGEPLAVNLARQRLRLKAGIPSKLAEEAAVLAQDNDLWVVGIPALMPKSAKGAAPANPMVDSVERFSFAMSVRDRMTGELNLHTKTPAAAEQLLGFYRMMETQAAATSPKEWEPVAKALSVENNASTLRFKLSLDPNELTPMLAERMKGRRPAITEERAAVPSRLPRVIRIQGLEDGPREIPFDGPR